MARPESVALGGYYPTPPRITKMIARLVDGRPAYEKTRGYCGTYALVDPCAGDGQAITDLANEWFADKARSDRPNTHLYVAELEADRARHLKQSFGSTSSGSYARVGHVAHGDAFCLDWGGKAEAHLLYLNPPYDFDRVHGRMEHRFLSRFTSILHPGTGILLFVVPHYALSASAEFIAREYEAVNCFRFPEPDYSAFKQVVLVARRRVRPLEASLADTKLIARINAWAESTRKLPELTLFTAPVVAFAPNGKSDIPYWRLNALDVESIYREARPWAMGSGDKTRAIHGLGFDTNITDVSVNFPVVMPLRPAHVAVALASGLINGREIVPDEPASGLPPLLAKGVFVREFRQVAERTNKDGDVTSVTMVQQPKLTVSILDLNQLAYYDLSNGNEPAANIPALADMNIADLLRHYGRALVRIMQEQCPPLHNPNDPDTQLILPALGLTPFTAQHHTIQSTLKLLAASQPPFVNENPFALGEVGTGKTLIALGLAYCLSPANIPAIRSQLRSMGHTQPLPTVRRVLVMCPPHLLKSWQNEVAKILPGTAVRILSSISDVNDVSDIGDDNLTIFLLSREMAKLGHAWEAALYKNHCPRCGGKVKESADEIISQRICCTHRSRIPQNASAQLAVELATLCLFALDGVGGQLVNGRALQKRAQKVSRLPSDHQAAAHVNRVLGNAPDYFQTPLGKLIARVVDRAEAAIGKEDYARAKRLLKYIFHMSLIAGHPGRDTAVAVMSARLYAAVPQDASLYGGAADVREWLQKLVLTMHPGSEVQTAVIEALSEYPPAVVRQKWGVVRRTAVRLAKELAGETTVGATDFSALYANPTGMVLSHSYDRQVHFFTPEMAQLAVQVMLDNAEFTLSDPCGSPLYMAVPQPRRVPLASYIQKRHRNLFDMLVLDEAHEYAHDGSAQERSAHRLAGMGKIVVPLTGTSNNGYASSLFMNMWSLSPRFRHEFDRGDMMDFVNRYGYRKVQVEPDEATNAYIQEYGRLSDRTASEHDVKLRKVGEAPGVSPLFVLRHLLPVAVTIHKTDLDIELPPMREIPCEVEAADGLLSTYHDLREKLMKAIMQDLRDGLGLAGKLWGQMAQIPTYLDRAHADTGNADYEGARRYEIRYPASVGGELVTAADPLPVDELTPKEEWLIETVAAELAEKRPCLILATNTRSGLAARLARLIGTEIGKKRVVILDPAKVSAVKRQEWIDRQIAAGVQVMITNPKAVETGLNNLVYFSSALWYQNPNVSSIMYTQGNGRVHRPGQMADEVRIYVPYYAGTTQEAQHMLLGHKVVASRQTDGLDITSALVAAGATDHDAIDAMSVGQAIYQMLLEGQIRPRAVKLPVAHRVEGARPLPVPKAIALEMPSPVGEQLRLLERRPFYLPVAG